MNENMVGMKPGEPKMGIVIDCKNLNVREQPNSSAAVLGVVPAGTELMVDDRESTDEFYKILTASGLEGFCMNKFIMV